MLFLSVFITIIFMWSVFGTELYKQHHNEETYVEWRWVRLDKWFVIYGWMFLYRLTNYRTDILGNCTMNLNKLVIGLFLLCLGCSPCQQGEYRFKEYNAVCTVLRELPDEVVVEWANGGRSVERIKDKYPLAGEKWLCRRQPNIWTQTHNDFIKKIE